MVEQAFQLEWVVQLAETEKVRVVAFQIGAWLAVGRSTLLELVRSGA